MHEWISIKTIAFHCLFWQRALSSWESMVQGVDVIDIFNKSFKKDLSVFVVLLYNRTDK